MENQDPIVSSRPDTTSHNVTIEEAAEIFSRAGVPRSHRTISRYCEQGILESVLMDTETGQKYLIKRDSVEKRIKEIKQFLATRHDKSRPDTSGHDQSRRDMSSHVKTDQEHGRPQEDQQFDTLKAEVKKLQQDNFQLRIDRAAKEEVINRMFSEREHAMKMAIDLSRKVGSLESKLLQLESPRRRETSDRVDHEVSIVDSSERNMIDPDERLPDEPAEGDDDQFSTRTFSV